MYKEIYSGLQKGFYKLETFNRFMRRSLGAELICCISDRNTFDDSVYAGVFSINHAYSGYDREGVNTDFERSDMIQLAFVGSMGIAAGFAMGERLRPATSEELQRRRLPGTFDGFEIDHVAKVVVWGNEQTIPRIEQIIFEEAKKYE